MDGADRRRKPGPRAERIAAGDLNEVVGATAQFVNEVGNQIVESAVETDDANQRFARDRFWRGKDRRFDAQHPFPPARGRRQIEKFYVERLVALAAAARGDAHRP
jgi:hypothetical protein